MRVLERLDAELSELGDQGRPSVSRQAAHLARLLAGADHPGRRAQEGS
jgi:hypothetical protein